MNTEGKKIRVLLTKARMDAHDRGVRYVASVLRDAGIEVIFHRFELPEEIVKAALEEDVDVIGISVFSGGHKWFCSRVMKGLKEKNAENILVILGGIIPDDDIPGLLEMGIGRVFGPGSLGSEIVDYLISQKG